MGWVETLPSGKFQGRYRNRDGKVRSVGTFTQRKQAQREADKIESDQRQSGAVDLDGGKIRWGDWFDSWHASRIMSYATEKNYRSTVKNHIRPYWGETKLADIGHVDVAKWIKKLHTSGASPHTIYNARTIFKASLQAAVDGNRLVRNPAKGVRLPDKPDATERFLTREEVDAITFYMSDLNALIVWTAVQTGLRFGELAGLHWHRLDLDRGVLHVVEKYDQAADRIDPVPKDKEKRTVPLPADLVTKLRRHANATPRHRTCGLSHTAGRCKGDLVFRGPRGAALKSNAWGVGPWRKALDLAGVADRVRVHDMRHTFASWLIQQGVPTADIARVMGHSDTEVTARYAHLQDTDSDAKIRAAMATPKPGDGEDAQGSEESETAAAREPDAGWQESQPDTIPVHEGQSRRAQRRANAGSTPLYLAVSNDAPDAG